LQTGPLEPLSVAKAAHLRCVSQGSSFGCWPSTPTGPGGLDLAEYIETAPDVD